MQNLDWRQWSSHKQRVVTGLGLAIPILFIVGAGPLWSLVLLIEIGVATGLWELYRILSPEGPPLTRRWEAFYISVGLLLPLGAFLGGSEGLHGALVAGLFFGFFSLLAVSPLDPAGLSRLARFSLAWLYIPYLLSFVLLIGRLEHGRAWIVVSLAVVVAGDMGAYYTGKNLGRHKLYERVSPKKTVEGSIGGFIASMVVGTAMGYVCLDGVAPGALLLLSGTLALVGQVGDLVESMMKRVSGIKDSSGLIPGHGGLLDRLDSLLFVFPAAWLFLTKLN